MLPWEFCLGNCIGPCGCKYHRGHSFLLSGCHCLSSPGRDYDQWTSEETSSDTYQLPCKPCTALSTWQLLVCASCGLNWHSRCNWHCPTLTCPSCEICCLPVSPSPHTACGCQGPKPPFRNHHPEYITNLVYFSAGGSC